MSLLTLSGVSKSYPKLRNKREHLRAVASLLFRGRLPAALTSPVLQNISLCVERGASLAVIGENGAGKSTLLKLLTGVLQASSGSMQLNGSIGALLELGAGFHPDLTGRENIELAGQLIGWSPREIKQASEGIIAFADIGDYIEQPIKHYSSGMVVRLGFAVLASRKPDLLITDEVLAVGDESFQKKCVAWTEQYLAQGGTLILVSHSMYHVQKLCRHALWLKRGRAEMQGEVFAVTQAYLAYHERKGNKQASAIRNTDHSQYQVKRVSLNGNEAENGFQHRQDEDLRVEADLYAPDARVPQILVGIVRADGTPVFGFGSEFDPVQPLALPGQLLRYRVCLPNLALLPGHYQIRVSVLDPEGVRLFDTATHEIVVQGASRLMGMVRLPYRWLTD